MTQTTPQAQQMIGWMKLEIEAEFPAGDKSKVTAEKLEKAVQKVGKYIVSPKVLNLKVDEEYGMVYLTFDLILGEDFSKSMTKKDLKDQIKWIKEIYPTEPESEWPHLIMASEIGQEGIEVLGDIISEKVEKHVKLEDLFLEIVHSVAIYSPDDIAA